MSSRLKDGQEAIYYITGDRYRRKSHQFAPSRGLPRQRRRSAAAVGPGGRVLAAACHRNIEGKPFKSITRGAADLDAIKSEDGEDEAKKDEEEAPAIGVLIAAIKLELGEAVKDVRESKRLTESPVCLVADEGDMDVNLERLLQRHGRLKESLPRILELNAGHGIVRKLAERAAQDGAASDPLLKDAAHLLLDQARIADGEAPADPVEFGRRLSAVMESAL